MLSIGLRWSLLKVFYPYPDLASLLPCHLEPLLLLSSSQIMAMLYSQGLPLDFSLHGRHSRYTQIYILVIV